MPPRISITTCLRASNSSRPSPQIHLPIRSFSASASDLAKTTGRSRSQKSHDPYVLAQQARKKAANLSRRSDLEASRVASLGDPIRGNTTPFIESFVTASPVRWDADKKIPQDETHLNYALKPEAVESQLKQSRNLAVPLDELKKNDVKSSAGSQYPWSPYIKYTEQQGQQQEPAQEVDVEAQRTKDHERATEAINRITGLDNASSKDRKKVNVARCVSTFGRHNTDRIMPPRAPPLSTVNSNETHPVRPETNIEATKKRIGPDTGSSEVQIAILTAKIKTVADFLASRGKGDKHNKKNLRLLVHRRQKLLQYLRRRERGGPRWQHCIETLGLTEGTWRGEISL